MAWTLDSMERGHLVFSTDGPATFELLVDEGGNTVLFGYDRRPDQLTEADEPVLAFDTDGSMWVDPAKRVYWFDPIDESDTQPAGFYRTDITDAGPWDTAAEAATAQELADAS